MRTPRFPTFAVVGVVASPVLIGVGFLFLFVSGIRYGIEPALPIGTAIILLGLALLTAGIVLIGMHRMLVSALPSPGTGEPVDGGPRA